MIPEDLKHLDASTIAARNTISFSSNQALIDLVCAHAAKLDVAPGHLAAKLVAKALGLFQEVTDNISPATVIADWTSIAEAYAGADTPWLFVAHRPLVIKLRLTACEFEVTTSAMANLLLAKGLEQHLEQEASDAKR